MSRSSLQKRTPLVHDEEQPEEPLAQVPLPSRQLPGAAIQVETEQLSGTNGLQEKRWNGTVSLFGASDEAGTTTYPRESNRVSSRVLVRSRNEVDQRELDRLQPRLEEPAKRTDRGISQKRRLKTERSTAGEWTYSCVNVS